VIDVAAPMRHLAVVQDYRAPLCGPALERSGHQLLADLSAAERGLVLGCSAHGEQHAADQRVAAANARFAVAFAAQVLALCARSGVSALELASRRRGRRDPDRVRRRADASCARDGVGARSPLGTRARWQRGAADAACRRPTQFQQTGRHRARVGKPTRRLESDWRKGIASSSDEHERSATQRRHSRERPSLSGLRRRPALRRYRTPRRAAHRIGGALGGRRGCSRR